jgi:microcin C transport system substrate-binding protein
VYWDKFGRPAITPKYGLGFSTWWVDPQKEAALAKRRGEVLKK